MSGSHSHIGRPALVRIGGGAGFAGDRPGAALPVVQAMATAGGSDGAPAYLIFETLAERTLALAQLARLKDPQAGYSPALEPLLAPVLAPCLQNNIRIVSNFGAANPQAAAGRIAQMIRAAGLPPAKIAVVLGDDMTPGQTGGLTVAELAARESDGALLHGRERIVAANVYLGARAIADALAQGAQIVVTGRVADPALALGPLAHEFGWDWTDWDRLAAGTLVGHLLECGPQVSGGYFADPGFKDAENFIDIGYPIAEVRADGSAVITKPARTGGVVDLRTVKEQMLYEIHDPAAYLTPDVVLNLTDVEVEQLDPDRVSVRGARGHARPATLKATVCYENGWFGEAEISYAGPNATARARLAIDIVRRRMQAAHPALALRADIIGVVSSFGDSAGHDLAMATVENEDVRVRFAARDSDAAIVKALLDEVEALYVAGPAGGGGVRRHLVPQLASASCLIERDLVREQAVLL